MELLSPAGTLLKLKTAILYGADAVYFGGERFGLRAKAGNLSAYEIAEAIKFLHERGKRGYLTANIYANEYEISESVDFVKTVSELGADGIIVSDPGLFSLYRKAVNTPLFISTQANTTNSSAVNFWADMGAARVILAREIVKRDLEVIVEKARCELEIFIHGAICISYSGRCLLSAYMTGRNANKGESTQPCRWKYFLKDTATAKSENIPKAEGNVKYLLEETRPNEPFTIIENDKGSYILNAKDLSLINRIGELNAIGITSGKIEGRMKGEMYVAVVTNVYRKAIDMALSGDFHPDDKWMELLSGVSNRHYTEGFYSETPDYEAMNYSSSSYVRNSDFLGVVEKAGENFVQLLCKAKITTGEMISFFTPDRGDILFPAEILYTGGKETTFTRAGDVVEISSPPGVVDGTVVRRLLKPL